MGQPAAGQTDQTQSCAQCGATLRLPRGKGPLLCFRCRASVGRTLSGDTAAVPFQKIASPARRAPLNLRRTALLVALALVVAALVYLPERRAAGPSAARPPSSALRGNPARRQDGIPVLLLERPRSAPTGAAEPSSKP